MISFLKAKSVQQSKACPASGQGFSPTEKNSHRNIFDFQFCGSSNSVGGDSRLFGYACKVPARPAYAIVGERLEKISKIFAFGDTW